MLHFGGSDLLHVNSRWFTGNILNSSDAAQFSVLPFVLLQQVLDNHPLNTEKGRQLRQQAIDMGILQLLLACLAVFTQQVTTANVNIPGNHPKVFFFYLCGLYKFVIAFGTQP